MSNKIPNPNVKPKYDLRERTAAFGEAVIAFVDRLPPYAKNQPLISQVVRASTSIGANYMEADGADSYRDFRYKIALCKKEAKETTHWIRMLAAANPDVVSECRILWQEAHELALIFAAILLKRKNKT